jgi:hypothetical protein
MPVLLPANRSMQDGSVSSQLGVVTPENRYRTGTPQAILDHAHGNPAAGLREFELYYDVWP